MEDHEKANAEKFTFADALDTAQEWVSTTKCGWLFLIGIFLVVIKVTGWLGFGDTPWINVLWPFIVVAGTILIVALVFYVKYDFKVVVESENEVDKEEVMPPFGEETMLRVAYAYEQATEWYKRKPSI